jgi:putative colanic acid biosynthesis acetyltransferase WcaF
MMFSFVEKMRSGKMNLFITFLGNAYLALWNSVFCYVPSYSFRRLVLKLFYGVKMGHNVNVHSGVKMLKPWEVVIGNNVNIQMGSFLDGRGGIRIGNNVDITLFVKILTQQHDMQDGNYTTISKPVIIEDNCVIGSYVLIMPGARINEGGVVGAGSVVVKDIPEWQIAVGNPCQRVKARSKIINYKVGYKRHFH